MSQQKTKKRYRTIGAVASKRAEDGTKGQKYIYVTEDVVLKKGDYLNFETKKQRLANLDKLEAEEKLSGDVLAKLRKSAEGIPDHYEVLIVKVEQA